MHASVARFRRVEMHSFEIDTEPLEPLPSPDPQSEVTRCWLNMFDGRYVLAQGFPTPPRVYGRGLELPPNFMIKQAAAYNVITYTVNGKDCMILKDRYTALVPVYVEGIEPLNQTSELQWHLVGRRPDLVPSDETDQIPNEEEDRLTNMYFSRIDRELLDEIEAKGLRILPIGHIQEVYSKRSFVGHFPKAQILLGSDKKVYDN
jgi:hypothetical protein